MDLPGIALLALLLLPQTTQLIKTVPTFVPGEAFHLEIRKTREDSRNPALGDSVTVADVVVKEAVAEGFVLEWVYGETRLQQEREPTNGAIQLDSDFRNLHISIVLKRDGGFYLQNAADMFDTVRARTDEMIQRGLLVFPESQRKQIEERVRLIATPESQRANIMRDVRLFLGFYGLDLETGKRFERAAPVLNPVGSGTVDSLMRAEVSTIDDNDVRIVVEEQYPPDVATMIAREATPPIVVSNPSDLSSAKVTDRTELSYSLRTGLFRETRREFGIMAGSFKRLDRIEILVTQ
jgi:hypothetical protein